MKPRPQKYKVRKGPAEPKAGNPQPFFSQSLKHQEGVAILQPSCSRWRSGPQDGHVLIPGTCEHYLK